MADLILEIGTEEIPAGYIDPALQYMGRELAGFLGKNRIHHGDPQWMGTPRRLVVWIPEVETRQADAVETHLGPNVKIAYDADGNPTKAAIGFARGKGLDVKDLTTESTPKGEVLCARIAVTGRPTAEILNDVLPAFIEGIPFPKKMRWSSRRLAFARPIHWIAALFDGRPLNFALEDIPCGDTSYGHRFLDPSSFRFDSLETYLKECEAHCVAVDPVRRRQDIEKQVHALAKEVGGTVEDDPDLLDIVTYLVEYPVAVRGEFDREYLDLPKELLVITMKHHQKYFPVWKGDSLLPYFITISNMRPVEGDEIRRGNQRVLRARLEDARFFFDEDRKQPLEAYVEKLKGVVFQKDLGTVYERVERIENNVGRIGAVVRAADLEMARRAARLCKADLVTQMVFEFPELQGIIGGYYARHSGEPEAVATAIQEHYKPAFAGDTSPSTLPGALVALADKLDTIVGCIAVGLIPSGSEDPYALRRHALGIIQILIDHDLEIELEELIEEGIHCLTAAGKGKLSHEEIKKHCQALFAQRLKSLLSNEGYDYDVIDAVLATRIDSFKNAREKARALAELKQTEIFEPLAIAFRRVVSIIEKVETREVNPKLLTEPAEKALYDKFQQIRDSVKTQLDTRSYSQALARIVELKPEVDRFFDTVMVNVDDAALKANRVALLYNISLLFAPIADFGKLVLKKS